MYNQKITAFPALSSTAVLSSVTGLIKNFMFSKFPDNYFKNSYITNSMVSISEQDTSDDDILRKELPMISIGVSLTSNTKDTIFLGDNIQWGSKGISTNARYMDMIYTRFFEDSSSNTAIMSLDERVKLNFSISIKNNSEIQSYNAKNALLTQYKVGRPFVINNSLMEFPIPREVIYLIALSKNINYKQANTDDINTFNTYIYNKSAGRITYKKNLSTGNFNYFVKYFANLMCKITDDPSIEKMVEGKTVTSSELKFNMETEFNTFFNFITEHVIENVPTEMSPDSISESDVMSYNFTSRKSFGRNVDDKDIICTFDYITDVNYEVDTTNFEDIIPFQFKEFFVGSKLKLIDSNGNTLPYLDQCVRMCIITDDKLLKSSDYSVDWSNFEIKIINPKVNYSYKGAIYLNMLEYNKYMQEKASYQQ